MKIEGSKRELEALLTACIITSTFASQDENEVSEVDSKILLKWADAITDYYEQQNNSIV